MWEWKTAIAQDCHECGEIHKTGAIAPCLEGVHVAWKIDDEEGGIGGDVSVGEGVGLGAAGVDVNVDVGVGMNVRVGVGVEVGDAGVAGVDAKVEDVEREGGGDL